MQLSNQGANNGGEISENNGNYGSATNSFTSIITNGISRKLQSFSIMNKTKREIPVDTILFSSPIQTTTNFSTNTNSALLTSKTQANSIGKNEESLTDSKIIVNNKPTESITSVTSNVLKIDHTNSTDSIPTSEIVTRPQIAISTTKMSMATLKQKKHDSKHSEGNRFIMNNHL